MGAPVCHGLIIHQLRHAEYSDGSAVQRRADLGQQLLGLDGLLYRLGIRLGVHLGVLDVFHRFLLHHGLVPALLRHLCLLHQGKIAGHADGCQT